MDSTHHPDTMTPDERQQEVANILARGLVRNLRLARSLPADHVEHAETPVANRLDLSAETRLSVAQPTAG